MDYYVGQELVLQQDIRREYIGGYGASASLESGTLVTVKKVGTETLWIRGFARHSWDSKDLTVVVGLYEDGLLAPADPNRPRPRQLGEVPEGGLSPDDPRLTWLWEDAAKLATMKGHCPTYDAMCDTLGIPGRERDFVVKREVNGFDISKKFKATSKKAAEALFDEELKGALA